jgi:hypothetical protein
MMKLLRKIFKLILKIKIIKGQSNQHIFKTKKMKFK